MTEPLHDLDCAATTRLRASALAAMLPILRGPGGNPSSRHRLGASARGQLQEARARIAGCLDLEPRDIVFTSGGTESNDLALNGAIPEPGASAHLIVSAYEHASLLEPARRLARQGASLTELAPGADGRIAVAEVLAALRPETRLVSVMAAQNETGALNPIAELSEALRRVAPEVLLHTDACQLLGRRPLPGADLISLSAHKVHGPQGMGALIVRRGRLEGRLRGGGQERGLRAGTENVAGAAGFAAALAQACAESAAMRPRWRAWRARLAELAGALGGAVLSPEDGLESILCLSLPGAPAELLVHSLAERGVAASSGAACSGGKGRESHVLAALGLSGELRRSALRLSFGWETCEADVDAGAAALRESLDALAPLLRRRGRRRGRSESMKSPSVTRER